jgi:hypothetical protein
MTDVVNVLDDTNEQKKKGRKPKTKNYNKYIPLLESFFLESKNFKSIVDINVFFLKKILDLLELRRDFYFSSKVLNKNIILWNLVLSMGTVVLVPSSSII